MTERLICIIFLFFIIPFRGMAILDIQSDSIQSQVLNEEETNLLSTIKFTDSEERNHWKLKTLKRKASRLSLGAKKPLSTLSLILGIIGVGILVISGFDVLAILITAIIGLAALIFGIIGIRKEGRGIGAIGMFLGGLGALLGLIILIGQLMG